MNRDQGEGAVKNRAGKTQQKAGKSAGSSERHVNGVKQSEPSLQKASDNVKAAFKNSRHS